MAISDGQDNESSTGDDETWNMKNLNVLLLQVDAAGGR